MTLQQLNRHRDIVLKLRMAEEQKAIIMAKTLGAANMDGMPHGTSTSDKVGSLGIMLANCDSVIQSLQSKRAASEAKVMEFINSIPKEDVITFNIFILRFIECLEWNDVANIVGGGNSTDAVKAVCYRYLTERNPTAP